MSIKTIGLAYCVDNTPTAEALEQQLGGVVDRIEHFCGNKNQPDKTLAEQLRNFSGPTLLIVSDNFLKTVSCMHRGLQMLQDRRSQLLPVIIDGQTTDDQTGKAVAVPTHFDRVSDIIQYINYWQDQYLDLRRQKRQIHDFDENAFNEHLRIMREISSEAGEYLRVLRTIPHLTLEQLETNDYEAFFRFVNATPDWDQFKRQRLNERMTSTPTPPVAEEPKPGEPAAPEEIITDGIPGLELLPEQPVVAEVSDTDATHGADESEPSTQASVEAPPTEETPVAEPIEETPAPTETAPEEGASIIFSDEPEEEEEEEEEEVPLQDLTPELHGLINDSWGKAEQGAVEDALHALAGAVSANPQVADLRYHYALLLVNKAKDSTAATRQLQLLLNADPDHEKGLYLQGELAEMEGQFEDARAAYEKLIDINPGFPDAHYRLGLVLANHFENSKADAAGHLKKAFKQNDHNADAAYQYAVLLNEALDKPHKAIKYFKRTLRIQPHHPFAWYDLALVYHQLGDRKAAFEAYERSAAINPEVKTPENDLAFHYEEPAPVQPAVPLPINLNAEEHTVIDSLKQTIARLETLLLAREGEPPQPQPEPEPEPPTPRPGEGLTVMITGATSGIGMATAERFAQEGYRIIITGRRYERLEALQKHLGETHQIEVEKLCFDVREVDAVKAAIDSLENQWQQIDILINNAGKAKGFDPIHEGHLEHWEEMIDTNIKGLLYLTRAIAPRMVARRKGHIINVGSTAGKDVYPNGNVYCASKFAIDGLTRAMRIDLHAHNVKVSQVSPAHVEDTEFALVRYDGDAEKARIFEDFKPLSATDVADAIYYIVSRPAYVNVLDVVLQGVQQASSVFIDHSGRDQFEEA